MNWLCRLLLILGGIGLGSPLLAQDLKVGIIGLDTSHSIAFTKAMNAENAEGNLDFCQVVAAYPHGSPDIESSKSRIPKYTEQISAMGVEIVDSIPALLKKVDAVLLETNDGRPHLEQVLPVLKAGLPVFVDKPVAGSLRDAIAIYKAADEYGVPIFSSSSLRFAKNTQAARAGDFGEIVYCETTSPASIEKTHPDLFWYGIHGVEALFTVMGTGCESVKRSTTDDGKIKVLGRWEGERTRLGAFIEGKGFSGKATNLEGEVHDVGNHEGYQPLLQKIADYFLDGDMPVSPRETLEIYAFMEAADESKRRGGEEVTLEEVLLKAAE